MSQDISWEVLQRELVEATQQLTIADSTLQRAETELRNAQANRDAAQAKADEISVAYDAARGLTGEVPATLASRQDVEAKRAAQAPATVDEAPSL